jgi:REP element-mobilizing transposase RayT
MNQREYIRQVIAGKRQWHTPVEPDESHAGFHGWYSRGYLPHFDKPGLVQFITYRLADAVPAARRHEWIALLRCEEERERLRGLERFLDRGYGGCCLRKEPIAALVQENLLHFDGRKYRLFAWVVMPNHVHVLAQETAVPLAILVKSWKSYTAHQINARLGSSGTVWQREYFDRYIRDREHFHKAIHYIEWNPVKAGLVREPREWRWSSYVWRTHARGPGEPGSRDYDPATNPVNRRSYG